MTRAFEAKAARRERTPIIVGIVAPSGGGKTKSALRMADGIARVVPGPIVVIDTEAKRSLHHADAHKFLHIDMSPPFSPADHIAAWTEAMRHNPSVIIQDSMSHEHDGQGGILEMHDAELNKRGGNDDKARDRNNMAAWIRPKAEHNRMKQFMLQQRTNWILCFRAKEKIKPVPGKQPEDMGWQALGAEDLIYECLVKCLLFPGADGRPTWKSPKMGEQQLMKLPGWFRDLFDTNNPRQLDEDIGEQLARWASGGDSAPPRSAAESTMTPTGDAQQWELLVRRLDACKTFRDFVALKAEARADWASFPNGEPRATVERAVKAAEARTKDAASPPANDGPPEMTQDEIDEIKRQESAGAR